MEILKWKSAIQALEGLDYRWSYGHPNMQFKNCKKNMYDVEIIIQDIKQIKSDTIYPTSNLKNLGYSEDIKDTVVIKIIVAGKALPATEDSLKEAIKVLTEKKWWDSIPPTKFLEKFAQMRGFNYSFDTNMDTFSRKCIKMDILAGKTKLLSDHIMIGNNVVLNHSGYRYLS